MSLPSHPQKNGKMGGGLHDPSEQRCRLLRESTKRLFGIAQSTTKYESRIGHVCLLYPFLCTRGIKGEKYGTLYCHTIVVYLYGA